MFVIDAKSRIPIFEQLKKQILEFISIGVLSANDQLPSVEGLSGTGGTGIYLYRKRQRLLYCG